MRRGHSWQLHFLQLVVAVLLHVHVAWAQCMSSEYQTIPVVTTCSGVSGQTSSVQLELSELMVMRIPIGLNGFSVQISSAVNLDIKMYDDANGTCIAGVGCSPGKFQGNHNYAGVVFYYSGDDATPLAAESVSITGVLARSFTVSVKGYAHGVTATIQWSHGAQTSSCPSPLNGCAPCSTYALCRDTETPTCDGSLSVFCTPTTTTSSSSTSTSSSTSSSTTSVSSTTTTTTLLKVILTGNFQITFASGVSVCSVDTIYALQLAIGSAARNITSLPFTPSDVISISIEVCRRRLEASDDDGRRLAATSTTVTYMVAAPGFWNSASAQALATAIAEFVVLFVSLIQQSLLSSGIATSGISISIPVVGDPGLAWDQSLWDNDTSTDINSDTCQGVAAPLWRLVGRGVTTDWQVTSLLFYRDMACTNLMQVLPQKLSHVSYYNGRAFDGPARGAKRGSASVAEVLVVGLSSGVASARSCGHFSDECHLGFEWFTDVLPAAHPQPLTRPALGARTSVQPRCVVVNQSVVAGNFAPTVAVQYRHGADPWQTLRVFSGLWG
eukprot:CAMPEP_0177538084 /NCGR_PEP_ID=MMETSP0369-20130122/58161_1 /TAXON_ID=447022 ORGANISM="Scrippsiella hangoei-like, Strain SHHI-4" /NCGR_SAMPLE_ID=MMETSP0369 /ASSEMBLY_ACC=CAM_ASM_000364 /LENGTH=554 /DNA_ID=CAMNT_0019020817 /DNA_START=1 /DNA_END=1663 /DNA_ORIENTATION=-